MKRKENPLMFSSFPAFPNFQSHNCIIIPEKDRKIRRKIKNHKKKKEKKNPNFLVFLLSTSNFVQKVMAATFLSAIYQPRHKLKLTTASSFNFQQFNPSTGSTTLVISCEHRGQFCNFITLRSLNEL